MKTYYCCVALLFATCSLNAQENYNAKSALTEERLEFLEYKVASKLEELNLKEDNLELSKQNVADIIDFHKERVDNFHRTLNYILVLIGIVITVATAVGGILLERYNKRKSNELKKDIEALRMSMQQSIDAIAAEANRELELIREEAKRQIAQIKNN